MTTQCMQTRLEPSADGFSTTALAQSRTGRSLKSLYALVAEGTRRLTGALARAQRRRAALGALSRLSDRQLTDIGLHRGQLSEVVDAMLDADGRPVDRGCV